MSERSFEVLFVLLKIKWSIQVTGESSFRSSNPFKWQWLWLNSANRLIRLLTGAVRCCQEKFDTLYFGHGYWLVIYILVLGVSMISIYQEICVNPESYVSIKTWPCLNAQVWLTLISLFAIVSSTLSYFSLFQPLVITDWYSGINECLKF